MQGPHNNRHLAFVEMRADRQRDRGVGHGLRSGETPGLKPILFGVVPEAGHRMGIIDAGAHPLGGQLLHQFVSFFFKTSLEQNHRTVVGGEIDKMLNTIP